MQIKFLIENHLKKIKKCDTIAKSSYQIKSLINFLRKHKETKLILLKIFQNKIKDHQYYFQELKIFLEFCQNALENIKKNLPKEFLQNIIFLSFLYDEKKIIHNLKKDPFYEAENEFDNAYKKIIKFFENVISYKELVYTINWHISSL